MPDGAQSDGDLLSAQAPAASMRVDEPQAGSGPGTRAAPAAGVPFVPEQAEPAGRRDAPGAPAVGAKGTDGPRGHRARRPAPSTGPLGMPRAAFAGIALLAASFLIAVVAAVAVPFVLEQRARAAWEATTVRLPEGWDGLPRDSGGRVAALLRTVPEQRGYGAYQAGLYGDGTGQTILVIATRSTGPLSARDQATARRGLIDFVNRRRDLRMEELDAGQLGGHFGCGQARGVTTCLGTDASSMVAVLVAKATGDPRATALALREATVRRR